jgi:inhibitor of cysteine peptidase
MLRKFVLITLALAMLAACTPAGITLTEANNGQTIQLKKDGSLSITLSSNPTTGFQWTIDQIDPAQLKQLGDPDYVSDCTGGMVGCGGRQTFRFTATSLGQSQLRLIYHRTFEANVPPAQTFNVTINIQ